MEATFIRLHQLILELLRMLRMFQRRLRLSGPFDWRLTPENEEEKKWRQPPITARRPAQQQFNNNSVTTTTVGINQLNRPFSSRSKLLRHFPLKCGNQRDAGNRHQTNTALPDMTK